MKGNWQEQEPEEERNQQQHTQQEAECSANRRDVNSR
jgi:hypothetical protein